MSKMSDQTCSLQVYVVVRRVSVKEGRSRTTAAAIRRLTTGCTPTRSSQPVFPNRGTCLVTPRPLQCPLGQQHRTPAKRGHYVICYSTRKLHTHTQTHTSSRIEPCTGFLLMVCLSVSLPVCFPQSLFGVQEARGSDHHKEEL